MHAREQTTWGEAFRGSLPSFAVLVASAATCAGVQARLPAGLAAVAQVVHAAAGLALVLFVPGMLFVPLWCRRGWIPQRPSPAYVLLAAGLSTVACHAASQKFVVWGGYLAEYWNLWGFAAAWVLLGMGASKRWGEPVAVAWPTRGVLAASVAGILALAGFAVATSPPHFVDETHYWPDKIYRDLSKLNYGHTDLARAGVEVTYGPEWAPRGDGVYDLAAAEAAVHIVNTGHVPFPLDMKLVLKNRWREGLVARFWLDGQPLREGNLFPYARHRLARGWSADTDFVRLWPPFDHRSDPRDRPMHLCLAAPTLALSPGAHVLRLRVEAPVGHHEAGPRLTVFDLSNRTQRQFYRAFTRHFVVGDTGDIYETLDFSRNFRDHWLQHSSSFDGRDFDGGGPTSLSDEPPGHHFLCFLALTFVRDSVTSISLLYLVELALLFWAAVELAGLGNGALRPWHLIPLAGVFGAYTQLCRVGLESSAPDTLFVLLWLCVVRAYLDQRRGLAAWLVGAVWLVHIPAPQSAVFLGLSAWLVTRRREGLAWLGQALMVVLLVAILRVLAISAAAGMGGALASGQAPFGGAQRMELLREILFEWQWMRVLDLAVVAREFARLVLIASCGAIPIFAVALFVPVRKPDGDEAQATAVLFLSGLSYYLAMSVIDFQRAHHVGPIVFPIMIATVRRLCRVEPTRLRRAMFVLSGLACIAAVGFLLAAGADYTGTFTRWPLYALTHLSNRRGYGFQPF